MKKKINLDKIKGDIQIQRATPEDFKKLGKIKNLIKKINEHSKKIRKKYFKRGCMDLNHDIQNQNL